MRFRSNPSNQTVTPGEMGPVHEGLARLTARIAERMEPGWWEWWMVFDDHRA